MRFLALEQTNPRLKRRGGSVREQESERVEARKWAAEIDDRERKPATQSKQGKRSKELDILPWKWKVFWSTVIVNVLSSSSSMPITAPWANREREREWATRQWDRTRHTPVSIWSFPSSCPTHKTPHRLTILLNELPIVQLISAPYSLHPQKPFLFTSDNVLTAATLSHTYECRLLEHRTDRGRAGGGVWGREVGYKQEGWRDMHTLGASTYPKRHIVLESNIFLHSFDSI